MYGVRSHARVLHAAFSGTRCLLQTDVTHAVPQTAEHRHRRINNRAIQDDRYWLLQQTRNAGASILPSILQLFAFLERLNYSLPLKNMNGNAPSVYNNTLNIIHPCRSILCIKTPMACARTWQSSCSCTLDDGNPVLSLISILR